ncbi:uncharacterized protein LOC130453910 [Monodelphis domestica]|uniref:uncharacterized protein LOC130453910 n=1 Tax=Monodelphis domestica TaxID=13616 RepID=UPI0024E1C64F|nr:uncharacterized protein LOC130453910 [Monodelphis domestica]
MNPEHLRARNSPSLACFHAEKDWPDHPQLNDFSRFWLLAYSNITDNCFFNAFYHESLTISWTRVGRTSCPPFPIEFFVKTQVPLDSEAVPLLEIHLQTVPTSQPKDPRDIVQNSCFLGILLKNWTRHLSQAGQTQLLMHLLSVLQRLPIQSLWKGSLSTTMKARKPPLFHQPSVSRDARKPKTRKKPASNNEIVLPLPLPPPPPSLYPPSPREE